MTTPQIGVRALVLTDVVDSTALALRIGDEAMATLWAAHDQAARALLRRWRGREIDRTDGMLLLFDGAPDALGFAFDYRAALAALAPPLVARTGIHLGPVRLRENAAEDVALGAKPLEVEGLAKPTAARVMTVAAGGQILLSDAAVAALEGQAPTAAQAAPPTLLSHGHWMFKGLDEPIELFEAAPAGATDVDFVTPPEGDKVWRVARVGAEWRPVREIPNNLPLQATAFIGRERERREVRALVGKARLLTLLGMGGLGKTRLSLQVASEVMVRFADGVWFLDLAPLRDPALVAGEAAQVLGVREEPGRPLLNTLCASLQPRRALVILDNCEHLLDPVAELAHALLRAAPGLCLLASSREPLRVPGEQTYPVSPLPLPARDAAPEALARSTAVRLFVDRVRLHQPAFEVGAREAAAVAELVHRLEGIPLALELAAARMRALGVAELNQRLKDRYKVLTGGGRVLLGRQQTLRALVDWSYDLLTAPERTAFARLSVFAGGFDLAAAEAVAGADPPAPDNVLDLLASLVDKSLVGVEAGEDGTRYRMLETLRDYAREKLDEAGDGAAAAARHCDHYFVLAKATRDGLKGAEQARWMRRGELELDNIRVAIAFALGGGVDVFVAVKLAVAMMAFWMLRGYASEGRQVVRAAMALPAVQASDIAHAHAAYVGAALAESQSDHAEARRLLESCLALRRRLGNPVEIAATLSTLSLARLQAGDAAGAAASEREALAIFRAHGERLGEAVGTLHLGQIAVYAGDDAEAALVLGECLAIARELRHGEIEAEAEHALGMSAALRGDGATSRVHLERSLAVCRAVGDRRGEARALAGLGRLDLAAGDMARARSQLGEALRTFRAFEMREEWLACLEELAALALRRGRADSAARWAGAAAELRDRLALRRPPREQTNWQCRLQAVRAALEPSAFDAAWRDGRSAGVDAVTDEALAPPAEA